MRLLFIQGGTRLKEDTNGNWYTDGNFNDAVWKRYTSLCDELIVLLRREGKIYTQEEAQKRFNPFDTTKALLVPLKDLYRPRTELFNLKERKKVKDIIEESVRQSDRVIIRSVTNFYTASALKICKKWNKPYALEVTGVGWDGTWYHGWSGKVLALYVEKRLKNAVADAPYVLYVTQDELQKRYPCKGKTVGCSNVELDVVDETALAKRLLKIKGGKKDAPIILGTIGSVSLKTKGQVLVIKALGVLKKKGFGNFTYQLVGGGDPSNLKKEAEKQDVEDQIQFMGSMPHEDIFSWLDSIDLYIQPSYQEGLCRSVVEAMSRACPVICSDACGERELAGEQFIFKRGDWKTLSGMILKILDDGTMEQEAKRSFAKSREYQKEILDLRRQQFYQEFMES